MAENINRNAYIRYLSSRKAEFVDDYGTVDPSAKVNAFGMAIEALEKQIPKKPKRYIAFDGIERNGCPACPKNEILYAGQKFCSVCGQAIDWSEYK